MSDRLVLVSATPMPDVRVDAVRVMHRVGLLARRGGGTLLAPASPSGPTVVPGVRHVVLDVPPGLDLEKREEAVSALLGAHFDRLKPAVVHAFGVRLAVPALLRRRARVVIEPGATPAQRLRDTLPDAAAERLADLVSLEDKTLARADAVIACSTVHASTLVQRGVRSERVWTVPDGVVPAPAAGPPSDLPQVVFVGDLDVWSGWETVLEGLVRLRQPWRATFVVPPDASTGALEARARHLGVGERVSLARLDADTAVRVEAAQVVVCALQPTRAVVAGGVVPESALWAIAGGRALVAPELPSVRAYVGAAGAYFEPGDPGALAAVLARVLDEAPLRADLIARAEARRDALAWEGADATLRDLWDTLRAG